MRSLQKWDVNEWRDMWNIQISIGIIPNGNEF